MKYFKNTKFTHEINMETYNRAAPESATTEIVHTSGTTSSKLLKLRFKWTIENFLYLRQNAKIESPTFSGDETNNSEWFLAILIQKGIYISISQKSEKSNNWTADVYILNSKGLKVHSVKVKLFDPFKIVDLEELQKESKNILRNGSLTIGCEINIVSNISNSSFRNIGDHPKPVLSLLSDNLGNLLQSKRLSDVTLLVGDQQFPAHKAILDARSDVFAAMFQHSMEEVNSSQVTISDCKPEVIEEMLQFIYTGNCSRLEELAKELFIVADKYALKDLKSAAEEMLITKLTSKTAIETLLLADRHSADLLRDNALQFVNVSILKVMETSNWNDMILTHATLIDEVLNPCSEA